MYTTYNNRQIERYLDREEGEVATGRCIQHSRIDREIVRQRGGGGRYRQMYTTQNNGQIERQFIDRRRRNVQIDNLYNNIQIKRQLHREKEVDRDETKNNRQSDSQQRGGGGNNRKMYTTKNNKNMERQVDKEVEEVATGRCTQHTTIYSQKDSQIVRRRRRQVQVDVYNIQQQID